MIERRPKLVKIRGKTKSFFVGMEKIINFAVQFCGPCGIRS